MLERYKAADLNEIKLGKSLTGKTLSHPNRSIASTSRKNPKALHGGSLGETEIRLVNNQKVDCHNILFLSV